MSRIRIYVYDPGIAQRLPPTPEPLLELDFYKNETLFETVTDPDAADFLVFPYVLDAVFYRLWGSSYWGYQDWARVVRFLRELPYFASREKDHVFVIHHDHDVKFGLESVFFRCSQSRTWHDTASFAIPHALDTVAYEDQLAPAYLTSFVGAENTSTVRLKLVESKKQFAIVPHFFEATDRFFGAFEGEIKAKMRQLFEISVKRSITVLCPKGSGRNSIRFFECMAFGSLPVLISDDCVLPYEELIPYEQFVIFVPENDVDHTVDYIIRFLQAKTPEEVVRLRVLARNMWLCYLSNVVQPEQYHRILNGVKQRRILTVR